MGKQVTVKPGYYYVSLPTPTGYAPYSQGETAVLTDAEYAALPTSVTRALGTASTVAEPTRPSTDPRSITPVTPASGLAQTVRPGYTEITLTGATATVITLAGFVPGNLSVARVLYKQDATGSRLVTHPTGTKWPAAAAPTLATVAAHSDLIEYSSRDGGATVYGELVAANYS